MNYLKLLSKLYKKLYFNKNPEQYKNITKYILYNNEIILNDYIIKKNNYKKIMTGGTTESNNNEIYNDVLQIAEEINRSLSEDIPKNIEDIKMDKEKLVRIINGIGILMDENDLKHLLEQLDEIIQLQEENIEKLK